MGNLRVGPEATKGLDPKRLEVEFKTIPSGTYDLGSDKDYDHNPIRREAVDSFSIAATEMTNAQWTAGVGQLGPQNTLLVHYAANGKATILARGTVQEIEAFKAQPISTNAGRVAKEIFGGIDVGALGALKAINLGSVLDESVQTVTLEANPSAKYNNDDQKFDRDAQPVVGVNWFEASAFAALYGWSLPTRTQWEVAAGDLRDPKYQNVDELERVAHSSAKNSQRQTASVRSKAANDHGLFDMLGNIYEWMTDVYEEGIVFRGVRGASWRSYDLRDVSALYRNYILPPANRLNYLGFRVVSEEKPQDSK